ncbi:cyclic-AMP phosphodiesterase [Obelidium mucronatum]|nr:cyclic-AMP phosphodiesterase [Obelidium mucronatum]
MLSNRWLRKTILVNVLLAMFVPLLLSLLSSRWSSVSDVAAGPVSKDFNIVVLGAAGGPIESRVSGYLIHVTSSSVLVSFDAGSMLGGLRKAVPAIQNIIAPALTPQISTPLNSSYIYKHLISAHFVSHPHLDHCAGLIIASQADQPRASKPIYGLNSTLTALREHAFNNILWPNLPSFGFYRYVELDPYYTHTLPGSLNVTAFPVSHADIVSTCFLLHSSNAATFLTCGDLGSDSNEHSTQNLKMWTAIAPLIVSKTLKGIMIECSFPNSTPSNALFGHLTPALLIQELRVLEGLVSSLSGNGGCGGGPRPLEGLVVIVQHIKETDLSDTDDYSSVIVDTVVQQLLDLNDLGIRFEFTHQHVGGIISI